MPDVARTNDRFHVIRLFVRAIDRMRAAEARGPEEKVALLKRARRLRLKNEANLKVFQLAQEDHKTGKICGDESVHAAHQ